MPKALIHFFSATGNSKLAAQVVGEGLENAGWGVDIKDIRTSGSSPDMNELTSFEFLGFVFPTYAFRAAIPMERFIRALPRASRPTPVFLIATFAGYLDRTFMRLESFLLPNNYVPVITSTLTCEDSWTAIRSPGWIYDKGKPDTPSLDGLREFAAQALPEAWSRNRESPRSAVGWVPVNPITAIAAMFPMAVWKGVQFPIFVKRALCNRCGACVRQCPMKRLHLEPFPVARGNCVGCYGCINVCPKDAINTWFTNGKLRYRGPEARHEKHETQGS